MRSAQRRCLQREFANGTVIYNPLNNNKPVTVKFDTKRKRASDGTQGTEFSVPSYDGDLFLKP
jgi:hypothetical protein